MCAGRVGRPAFRAGIDRPSTSDGFRDRTVPVLGLRRTRERGEGLAGEPLEDRRVEATDLIDEQRRERGDRGFLCLRGTGGEELVVVAGLAVVLADELLREVDLAAPVVGVLVPEPVLSAVPNVSTTISAPSASTANSFFPSTWMSARGPISFCIASSTLRIVSRAWSSSFASRHESSSASFVPSRRSTGSSFVVTSKCGWGSRTPYSSVLPAGNPRSRAETLPEFTRSHIEPAR